jgi:DNA primase
MNRREILSYYSRDDVIKQFLKNAKDREVAGAFWNGSYDQRPNILQYPQDVIQMVVKGITSFHFSVEHWKNPMQVTRENYEELRTGWDLIFDIDSKIGMRGAQIAALKICKTLNKYNIKNIGIKFSGSRGFHLCISWKQLPKFLNYKPMESMYPGAAKTIVRFVKERMRKELLKDLIREYGAKELLKILDQPPPEFDPYYFVDVEENWGSRHMFRAPYSLNEKTWLVSKPLSLKELKSFSFDIVNPKNVKADEDFFVGEDDEALDLVMDAMDWETMQKKEETETKKKQRVVWKGKVGEEFFPPCIKQILKGLSDGRKRSIFTLINFLRAMNWAWPEIEEKVMETNKKNSPSLPNSIVIGQLRWNQRQKEILPANCESELFYKSIGVVCKPDNICKRIKNPVNYPFILMRIRRPMKKRHLYECSLCKKKFKSMKSLNIHQARMHGM